MNERLLTCVELAMRLQVRPSTVRDWARKRRIPAIRIGPKVIRFDYSQVTQALQSQRDLDDAAKGRGVSRD